MKFALRASEICFACEMRTCVRVKWRFSGSADVVSLRDGSEFRGFVGFCPRASVRDATSITLRLPRRCAPRNDTNLKRFYLENGRFWSYSGVFNSDQRLVFPQNLSEFVIARRAHFLRPTRQSETERNGIPEGSLGKQSETVCVLRPTSLPCAPRFVLPCFGSGRHVDHFKIAASLRSSQ